MTDKKKILYVITKSAWGGAQRYVFDLATNLSPDRFEVTVAAGGAGPLLEKLQKMSIRTIKLPGLQRDINIWKELASFWYLFKIFCSKQPDIIHLNSTKVGILGAIAVKLASFITRHSSFVIFTVHGWSFKEDRSRPVRSLFFLASWFSSFFQDKIILINTADYHTARRFIPQRKLTLIRNGISRIDFLPRDQARAFFTKKIGREFASDATLVGTVAELTKNKGLEYLIEALGQLRTQRKFLAIIMGDGEEKNILEHKIKELNLAGVVFLQGFVTEAARLVKAFDIFVLPSLKEGLPYVIMEAQNAGLPIIASRVGGLPDLIENGKDGILISPASCLELKESIAKLLDDKLLRSELGFEAYKKFRNKFGLPDMLRSTISVYEKSNP